MGLGLLGAYSRSDPPPPLSISDTIHRGSLHIHFVVDGVDGGMP